MPNVRADETGFETDETVFRGDEDGLKHSPVTVAP
jgi:hypothetical protein